MDWEPPTSVHQIRNFLGLAGYYRRFIPDFSRIVKPIKELLKKGVKFVWDDKCEKAFQTLKERLTTAPVLATLDSTKPFDVYCDASGTGLGCCNTRFTKGNKQSNHIHARIKSHVYTTE